MNYNVVLTTAEDIVAVVDAINSKGSEVDKGFISKFTGIATEEQVTKAIEMAKELSLVTDGVSQGCYVIGSFLGKLLVSAISDEEKAVVMRIILEQYPPYNTFKIRHEYTHSIDLACRQTKLLHSIQTNERDIKNTLISIATYSKALKSEGANLYSFNEDKKIEKVVNTMIENSISDNTLRIFFGEAIYSKISFDNVFQPLSTSFTKTKADNIDDRSVIVYAANAFESFLSQYAAGKNISLAGKNGILQKSDALSSVISKKHRGMIDYIGQVRNAADHGSDNDEGGRIWDITIETAKMYPRIVAVTIKNILQRDGGIIEV